MKVKIILLKNDEDFLEIIQYLVVETIKQTFKIQLINKKTFQKLKCLYTKKNVCNKQSKYSIDQYSNVKDN